MDFRVLDVSNPATAREIGRRDEAFGETVQGAVPLHGNHAYLIPNALTTMYIVDLAQPNAHCVTVA